MQYERLTDNTLIIVTETGESQLLSSSLNTNRNVRRIRKSLLILLLIHLILSVILLMIDGRLVITDNIDNYRQGIRSLGPILFSFVYYIYGLIAIYRYHHLRIYVFSWLGFLQYICLCGELFINILFIIKHPSYDKSTKLGFRAALIIIITSLFQAILIVITLKLAFKLMHFIKIFKRDILEQI